MKKEKITVLPGTITQTATYPLYFSAVSAGFPSPADDYIEQNINLHDYLVSNPPATFFVKVEGDSMTGAGIFDKDILIVDRSLEAKNNKVVIAVVDGELTVKRLKKTRNGIRLDAENPKYPSISIARDTELTIWGVVTRVIHTL